MKKLLNEFEVMTLHEAYKRIKDGNNARICVPAKFKDCKKNLPILLSAGYIHKDTLKFCGMVVLTDKGIEAGKKLDEAISN